MLTFLLSLLSSAGFGSFIGLAGGLINRWADYKFRKADNEFELLKMDKEREYMKDEYSHRIQIAMQEKEAMIESHAYDAMTASYSFAKTTKEDGWIDKLSKLIRPLLTIFFFFFSIYVFFKINSLIQEQELKLSPAEIFVMWKTCIEWILFQAGAAIGWWFAMRPGSIPKFGR